MRDSKVLARVFGGISWLLTLIQVALAVSVSVPESRVPSVCRPVSTFLQQYAWMLVAIPFWILLVDWIKQRAALPWFKNALHEVLNQLQSKGFSERQYKGDPLDYHRITLFHYCYFCWRRWPFFGGFLVPKLRSNHLTQKMDVVFRCPDKGEIVEGIAGRAFRTGENVSVTRLPNVSLEDIPASDIQEYADNTFVSVEWVQKNQPHARSYMGIPIRVGGKISWVLVVDSREPDSQKALRRIENGYGSLLNPLVRFLENMP